MVGTLKVNKANKNPMMKVDLLIWQYIYIVEGLYYDFKTAWKSGKKPSPIRDNIKYRFPIENRVNG